MSQETLATEERDCCEGCADDGHKHLWEVGPHPYGKLDFIVADSDREALGYIRDAAEWLTDDMEPGQERVITIRMNKL